MRSASLSRVFVPVLAGVAVAAVAGLPLFQDGSSYLFEILLTRSAVRHHRASVLLIQLPTIVTAKLVAKLDIDDGRGLALVRLVFSASYALVPLIALGLSWLILRRTRQELLIWPALIILFVNLVNFSWVSELLIGVQLCCPLLLAWIVAPGRRGTWITTAVLLPIVCLLHPLISPVLLVIAMAMFYAHGRNGTAGAAVFASAAVLRALASTLSLTAYEASFLAPTEMREYLILTSWENVLFLLAALAIGVVCWRARAAATTERELRMAYRTCMVVAGGAAAVLVAQYIVHRPYPFPLKTGLAVAVAAALMLATAVDTRAAVSPIEARERIRLVTVLACVFLAVVVAKSLMWRSAVASLARSVASVDGGCVEPVTPEFAWLHRAPHTIIDNWALPTLALVTQDSRPRTLLLQPGDCRRFFETRMVQIDPWSLIPARALVPRLD
jgi:hypothetical protein